MTERLTTGRYPGYDVMSKRKTPSWNDKTREVIDARLAVEARPAFLSADEWQTLVALCDRVMPQPEGRPRVPLAAYVDRQLLAGKTKGYRFADMPQPAEAWKRALAALDEVARREQGRPFAQLTQGDQDAMLASDVGRLVPCGRAERHAGQDLLDLARHSRCGRRLLRSSRSLERDRLGRPRFAPWLCTHRPRPARLLGAGGSRARQRRAKRAGRTSVSADPLAAPRAIERSGARCVPARRLGPDAAIRRRGRGRLRRDRHGRGRRPDDRGLGRAGLLGRRL